MGRLGMERLLGALEMQKLVGNRNRAARRTQLDLRPQSPTVGSTR